MIFKAKNLKKVSDHLPIAFSGDGFPIYIFSKFDFFHIYVQKLFALHSVTLGIIYLRLYCIVIFLIRCRKPIVIIFNIPI